MAKGRMIENSPTRMKVAVLAVGIAKKLMLNWDPATKTAVARTASVERACKMQ